MLVVPLENEFINVEDEGKKLQIKMPIAIAKNIHKVKYLSRKLNFFLSAAGAQSFAVIVIYLI